MIGPPSQQYGPPTAYGSPPATITKNVYVHLPPEDHDNIQPPQVIEPLPPQKHYKLIFIKAPEPPKPVTPIIPPQPQDEHKTLGRINQQIVFHSLSFLTFIVVYVLVKKPDPQPQISLPTPEPTQPAKPEVYFIKYKKDESPVYGPPTAEYGAPSTY